MEFNLGQVFTAVAAAVPDRDCVVQGPLRRSYGEVAERSNRLANFLLDHGLAVGAERGELRGHESGQAHLGCYLHNGPEYLEAMLGSYASRVAPFNVNYRYVAEELRYLLDDAGAQAVVYHAEFAPTLAEVLDDLDPTPVLLQVADASGHPLLPGAIDYEAALAGSSPEPPAVEPSPEDLYILYTGGTTGMPKGVLWRQADIFVAALGGRELATGEEWPTIDAIVEAARNGGARTLPAPPSCTARRTGWRSTPSRAATPWSCPPRPTIWIQPSCGAPSNAKGSASCSSSVTPSADPSPTSSIATSTTSSP